MKFPLFSCQSEIDTPSIFLLLFQPSKHRYRFPISENRSRHLLVEDHKLPQLKMNIQPNKKIASDNNSI